MLYAVHYCIHVSGLIIYITVHFFYCSLPNAVRCLGYE